MSPSGVGLRSRWLSMRCLGCACGQLAPCEAFLGDMVYRWKKRQAQQPGAVKQVRPFIATT